MERKLVVFLVIALLAISLGQTVFIYHTSLQLVSDTQVTAKVTNNQSASVDICINWAPEIFNYTCSTSLTQNVFYSCQINASDPDNISLSYSLNSLSGGLGGTIDSNGLYAVTPNQNMTGTSTLSFTVNDGSSCVNNNASLNVTFSVSDVNDPPEYTTPISDVNIDEGSSFRGIFLNDYFTDPDGDVLNYTYFSFSSDFSISIVSATSEVIIIPQTCTDGSIIFQAKDPFNLTADSDVITISMSCIPTQTSSSSGGGGSSSLCRSEWECQEWERCKINGSQRRTCIDINGCQNPNEKYFWQECVYVAHCYNEVQDIDEEGIDCGGRNCPICETCSDNKLNNREVEVDCGGPNCNACSNCADGIQNYQETGLDCGGPTCEPCPTCNDGIQNQNETGLDCGGPFCSACTRIENAVLLDDGETDRLNIILLSGFLGVVALAVTYRIFKNQIHAIIAATLLSLALKKHKQILLSNEQKDFILERIASLEKKDLLEKERIIVFQDLLSRLQRQFFSFLIEVSADTHSSIKSIESLKTSKVLRALLKKQFLYLIKLEKEKNFSKLQLEFAFESFRTLIFSISRVQKSQITREIKELDSHKSPITSVLLQDLYNAMLASQFSKDAVARKKYLAALHTYQKLSDTKKELVYDELVLTFNQLTYVNSFR